MPLAGQLAEDRAHAHYRWAERYHGYGDHKKAAAHFGRALDYSDEASFGVAKRKPEMKQPKQQGGLNQTATFKRKRPSDVVVPAGRHCKVCKTIFDLEWYRDTSHDKCFLLCGFCAKDFLESGDFIREPRCVENDMSKEIEGIESMRLRDNSDNSDHSNHSML